MTEKDWVESIKKILCSANLSPNIRIDTLKKLLYTNEVLEYDLDFSPNNKFGMSFETDLLIYEQNNDIIKPRIVIEAKLEDVTTHDAITYSYKAQNHKSVTPFLRYGIMLGNRKHYPLPGRLFRHGSNFDFMISFQKETLTEIEKVSFVKLLKNELKYSQQLEEILLNSRNKSREHYFILEKRLYLE
jgi:hypothetical protein